MIARTSWGRALAVAMSVAVSQIAVPAAQAAAPPPEAGQHLVDRTEIAGRLLESAQTREQRVKLFQDALATDEVRRQARALGADPDRLHAAVPHLSDSELAELAARATQVRDVAAGHGRHYGNGGLVLIGILLLVAGIVVLAAVLDDDYYDDYYWDDCYCY